MNEFSLTNDYELSQTPLVIDGVNYVKIETHPSISSLSITLSTTELYNGFYDYFGITFKNMTPSDLENFIRYDMKKK